MHIPKTFNACEIPDSVENDVVYSNPQIVASGCKLHCADVHLGEKEAHKFIKEVVRAGKTAVFNHLLSSNFQLKVGDLVYFACQHGHVDMRIDPNKVTKYGWTALEISAINGRTEIVRMLVMDHGADVNLRNRNNHFTPLENAIEGGHLDTVVVMMEELEAQFQLRETEVSELETAAAVVISQGELINSGQEHKEIRLYLEKKNNLPPHIENRINYRLSLKK